MEYGHFSSVVQLGVGIHAGTALLRLAADFGLSKTERRVETFLGSIQDIAKERVLTDRIIEDAGYLGQDLRNVKAQFEREFIELSVYSTFWAFLLFFFLCSLAFLDGEPIDIVTAVVLCAISVVPATTLVLTLWFSIRSALDHLERMRSELEDRILASPRQVIGPTAER